MSKRNRLGAVVAVVDTHDAFGLETVEYRLPKAKRLSRRLRWRLWRMRRSLDVETLDVFEHEISAFENAGLADLARQRTRHESTCEALQTIARSRIELVDGALRSVHADLGKAEAEAGMLERKLAARDPQFHSYA
ncbi:hypothetical protein GCM10027414_25580 [Humibacter ginsengiterrae]|jgi:hypothetical protein